MDNMGKYRGQKLGTKEWVYGQLVINKSTNTYRIVENFALCCDSIDHSGVELVGCSGKFHLVNPKTVSQFTGKTDKNGVELYGGDNIKCYNIHNIRGYEKLGTGAIEFIECCFSVKLGFYSHTYRLAELNRYDIEKTGTIYDEATK